MLSEPHPWNCGCHIMPTHNVGKDYSALGALTDHHVWLQAAPHIALSASPHRSYDSEQTCQKHILQVFITGVYVCKCS